MKTALSQAELNKLLKFWAKVLRLQDWKLTVRWGKNLTVRDRPAAASASIHNYFKTAEILIGEEKRGWEEVDDPEMNLVHELLHLHMEDWGVEDYSPDECAKEQCINLLADALINLKRKKPGI